MQGHLMESRQRQLDVGFADRPVPVVGGDDPCPTEERTRLRIELLRPRLHVGGGGAIA